MLLIPETPAPPLTPDFNTPLDQIGRQLIERNPALGQSARHGLYQAFQLKSMTEQLYKSLEQNPNANLAQKQALRILSRRREKDLHSITEHWGLNNLDLELIPAPCQGLEDLLYEYRWQQRTYQCLAWINELQMQTSTAYVFQTCADNLIFDLGCLQLVQARSTRTP
jgi:hypothetical protein